MAVQAQYPSNILLLNRSGQEGHDYSLPVQTGGFLDQSHMFFNSSASNSRKRGRESVANSSGGGNGGDGAGELGTNRIQRQQFTMQNQQQTQLIDLSQLHNNHPSQPNVVSTGLRLSFGDQQQQMSQNHHYPQQSSVRQSSPLFPLVSEDLSSQIQRQRDELDQFLQAQGEQLRRTLAEKRNRHYRTLLGAAEESITRRLREKEAEAEKAMRRNAELEARAAQLSMDTKAWQEKARLQEAMAAALQMQLQQAMMSGGQESRGGGGEEEGQAEDAESAYVDPERVVGPSCKGCRRRAASVVLLPCRHLCVCKECDQVIETCPLCHGSRNSSVEVFLC